MDKVKLQIHNKKTNETYIRDEIYDRDVIEKWIRHQEENASSDVLEWSVVDI